jgi:hypothetical protein
MKNETTQPKTKWETPDMTVLPINDVTLGEAGPGPDFSGEFHTSV